MIFSYCLRGRLCYGPVPVPCHSSGGLEPGMRSVAVATTAVPSPGQKPVTTLAVLPSNVLGIRTVYTCISGNAK